MSLWLVVSLFAGAEALVPAPGLPRLQRRVARRGTPTAFFESLLPNPAADERLDGLVKSAKAVLFTDGGRGCEAVKQSLKAAKVGSWKEVRLDQEADGRALVGALKRRVGTAPPTLVVGGAVLDQKRIQYLIDQDMMLPFFRQAGTSGEVRLPFQDLRYYLSKTIT